MYNNLRRQYIVITICNIKYCKRSVCRWQDGEARLGDEHEWLQLPVGVPRVRVSSTAEATRLRVQAAR